MNESLFSGAEYNFLRRRKIQANVRIYYMIKTGIPDQQVRDRFVLYTAECGKGEGKFPTLNI